MRVGSWCSEDAGQSQGPPASTSVPNVAFSPDIPSEHQVEEKVPSVPLGVGFEELQSPFETSRSERFSRLPTSRPKYYQLFGRRILTKKIHRRNAQGKFESKPAQLKRKTLFRRPYHS